MLEGSQPPMTPVLEDLPAASGLHAQLHACVSHKFTEADRQAGMCVQACVCVYVCTCACMDTLNTFSKLITFKTFLGGIQLTLNTL